MVLVVFLKAGMGSFCPMLNPYAFPTSQEDKEVQLADTTEYRNYKNQLQEQY